MKKFGSILLSIILGICGLFTLLLAVVRVDLNYSAITKIAGEILKPVAKVAPVEDGLFHPNDKIITLAQYDDYGDFDFDSLDLSSLDFTNLDVNEIVGTYLEAAGVEVEPEVLAEIIASPDVSDFVDKYVGEVVDYVTGNTTELKINPDDITKVLNKSIDMYEDKTGEVIDRTGLNEAIAENVDVIQSSVTEALDTAKEENAGPSDSRAAGNALLSIRS